MSEFHRCGWCARRLRWWQWKHCRRCHLALTGDAGIYLQGGGPPYPYASQMEARPDTWRKLGADLPAAVHRS